MNSIEDMAKMANGDFTPNFIGPDFLGISLQFYLGKIFHFTRMNISSTMWCRFIAAGGFPRNILLLM